MKSVKAAHLGLVNHLKKNTFHDLKPIKQNKNWKFHIQKM